MAVFKRIMRLAAPRAVACWLAARYIRLVHATGRWTVEGEEIPAGLLSQNRSFVVAFWHGRLLMATLAWPAERPFRMVISEHPDGRLIARTNAHLGIETIVGSSTRGGMRALLLMMRTLRDGICVGVTPDGPRGPRMRAGPGAARTARLAGVPILPLAFAAGPCRLLDTWDRLMMPLPFGRGLIAWGAPITVPSDADDAALARITAELEARLNDMQRALDERLGIGPVEPAAEAARADA